MGPGLLYIVCKKRSIYLPRKPPKYPKTAISLATVGLKKPFSLLVSLIPHIIVLAAFGAFVEMDTRGMELLVTY
jgi:hypothetical protein